MKKPLLFITILLLFAVLSSFVLPVLFSQDVAMTPAAPATNDSLNCTWMSIDDNENIISANVTWYNGTTVYQQEHSINCTNSTTCTTPLGIPGSSVRRGEIWNCTVTIYNTSDNKTQSVKINVTNANPVMQEVSNVTVFEDVPYSTTITAVDPDEDTLSWFSNDNNYSNDLFSIGSSTGLISFTPTTYSVGNHTMDIVVIDGYGGSDAARVTYWVKEVNDPPAFTTALNNQTLTEGVAYSLTITATDEENATFNFSLRSPTLTNLTLVWVSNSTVTLTFNNTDAAPAFTDAGNHTVNITVYELANTSVNTSRQFNLDIRQINHDPVLDNISNQTGTQGLPFVLDVNASDIDVHDNLTFSVTTNCSLPNPWSITTSNNSFNATGYINLTLNNSHVVCRFITITVTDSKTTDSQVVFVNVTNTNDRPIINNISQYATNTAGQNITNQTIWYGVVFRYRINATDIDQLTYANDTLIYATNDTLFPVNNATGQIETTINDSMVGNHTIQVNVTDSAGEWYVQDMNVDMRNNSVPQFTTNGTISCAEDLVCIKYIDAFDPDPGENLSMTSNDTSRFPLSWYNSTASRMNKTFSEDDVGNYSVTLNVTDHVGATTSQNITLQVNNTNDAPFFDMNRDNTSDNIILPTLVEDHVLLYWINVTDYDLKFGDNLTFNVVITGSATDLFNVTKIGTYTAFINYTPNTSSDGNYTINISVVDTALARDYRVFNITIHNASAIPNITRIQPYYNDTLLHTVFDWTDAEVLGSGEIINVSENTSVFFNASATDADDSPGNLTYRWYVNGTLNKTVTGINNTGVNLSLSFFSAGTWTILLDVEDPYYSKDNFTWTTLVANLNRAPLLINTPPNLTGNDAINATVTLANYFSYYAGAQRFIDPDDDLNGNNQLNDNTTDPGEVFNLSVNSSNCSVANLYFYGSGLTIQPVLVGTCRVYFTAKDSDNASVMSGEVQIDVNDVPTEGENTQVVASGGGGGGGGATVTKKIVVPQNKNVDSPKPVEIVVPGHVIMYENKTMKVPIIIKNNWNATLTGISLKAATNNSHVEMNFTTDFIRSLEVGQEVTTTLIVNNYRESGPYEIAVTAKVANPAFEDTGTIYVNSIEEAGKGREVEIKISFAKDLLTTNQECQELNELLEKAEKSRLDMNYDAALNYVDSVVNGCKYLMNQVSKQKQNEAPAQTTLTRFKLTQDNLLYGIAGLLVLVLVFLIIFIMIKKQEMKLLRSLE
jgi:hypothetical protein